MTSVAASEDMAALQDASCRVAFAAFLHDLGKLAQRASVFDKDPRRKAHLTNYCPYDRQRVHHTHLHAADTALALDALEPHLPALLAGDPFPFRPRGSEDVTDSLINAAAMHHRPETFLQWVVATADRVASGFERTAFKDYNAAEDREDFRAARMMVRFEEYQGPGNDKGARARSDLNWRYPLEPLCPQALMPVKKEAAQGDATAAYRQLWDALMAEEGKDGIGKTPKSHRAQWPLWLDHFDTLWLTVAHAIPSATAGDTRPDVSLYDHSKSTAAFATALWRYHHEQGDDPEAARAAMASRADWDQPKFLLVQGDFSGIQAFVFGGEGVTQQKAAKMLRGRSALVSLLTELAALAVLDALALPPTSQVQNAAGKFLIVAPNTDETAKALAEVRARLDGWFLEQMFGLTGVALAAEPASCDDFVGEGRIRATMARLWRSLEVAKRRMFALAAADGPEAVRMADFSQKACAFDGRLPASMEEDDEPAHPLSAAAIRLGQALADPDRARLLIFRAADAPDAAGMLPTDLFGYRVLPTGDREASGNFGAFAQSGALRRAFDISLPPADPAHVAWHGYARRALSAFVPLHGHQPEADARYQGLEAAERGALKTFEHLARDDRTIDDDDRIVGVEALGVLKGDIDDLGAFFASQGAHPSFARWAESSRRVNAFFTTWVPARLARDAKFRNIYTVFAGGDDFMFVGPWRTLRKFAWALRQDFRAYVAENDALHFSAGYVMAKPGHPVRQLAREAEDALAHAKARAGKNAFALHGGVIGWTDWQDVETMIAAVADHLGDEHAPPERGALSSGFLYGLLQASEMKRRLDRAQVNDRPKREDEKAKPQDALWRSRLFYQTRRFIERAHGRPADEASRKRNEEKLLAMIAAFGERGIARSGDAFRVALFDQLYARRD